jgi:hypothetical protein
MLPHLHFFQVGFAGSMLQASPYSSSRSFVILELPQQLTGLTLLCKTPEGHQHLCFRHGALPSSLQSLSISGAACSIQAPYRDTSSNALGWQAAASASSGAEGESSSSSSSSSSRVPPFQSSAGAQALAALPLLQRAEVMVESLQDAADMFRWVATHLTMFNAIRQHQTVWQQLQHMREGIAYRTDAVLRLSTLLGDVSRNPY